MFEKLIDKIVGKNSISLEKITGDFNEITNLMLKSFDESSEKYCCHDMAYFVNAGMKKKGYNSKVVDGANYYGPACKHSWVEVKGDKINPFDKYILNLNWHAHSSILGIPVDMKIFTKSHVLKHKLLKKEKIYYELNPILKEITDSIFQNQQT